ncbi:MAG: CRISPR-associated helicase Cas3' [Clostridiales bacterium]|nr:CRISPR-associated helicase Cas3' [Clostridiales bacterium]
MDAEYIAHVRQTDDDTWAAPHFLEDHLRGTADRAGVFAAKFNSGEWGYAAGISHDAGKGRREWQKYLRLKSGYLDDEVHKDGQPRRIPHAIHGAKLVEELYGKGIGRILSYCIVGHHAGLPDWFGGEGAGRSSLEFQMGQVKEQYRLERFIVEGAEKARPTAIPRKFSGGLDTSLWIRMLYSCLVDADYLDTEFYMEGGKAEYRGNYCTISELLGRLNDFYRELEETSEDTPVNRVRRKIRDRCVKAAKEPQGIFSLTVPTGGGKTLASMAFGLEHAKAHNLDRIIYVIPYTSIIEQNAEVFRKALGSDQVIEHHSSLDEEGSTKKSRLAAENWDAPVIVTTTVQFFESLFASKPGRCRKLHNIVNSVIVLDEAQLLPTEYLAPILEAMQLLVDYYHVSFVISTATQPAFEERSLGDRTFNGLKNINEIMGGMKEVKEIYNSLKRVTIKLPDDFRSSSSWEEIAEKLKGYKQVLCIVSDRRSCRELHSLMPESTYHLSALMCGQHRSEMIKTIKDRLKDGKEVRVISTQLVEAGVDFDFPVVYRALAGLDSIAQAAGRCNREGKLPGLGKVVVFVAPKKAPVGILRKATETACHILSFLGDKDPLDNTMFKRYFEELYWKANSLDMEKIIPLLTPEFRDLGLYFRTASERFRIIDDSRQKTILVRYGDSDKLIDLLRIKGPDRSLMRKLQRYTVNVYNEGFYLMRDRGSIEEVQPGIFAMTSGIEYSKKIGLMVEETIFDPEDLIV